MQNTGGGLSLKHWFLFLPIEGLFLPGQGLVLPSFALPVQGLGLVLPIFAYSGAVSAWSGAGSA
eukprot:875659-Amphidinium_carterae.1